MFTGSDKLYVWDIYTEVETFYKDIVWNCHIAGVICGITLIVTVYVDPFVTISHLSGPLWLLFSIIIVQLRDNFSDWVNRIWCPWFHAMVMRYSIIYHWGHINSDLLEYDTDIWWITLTWIYNIATCIWITTQPVWVVAFYLLINLPLLELIMYM